MEQQCQALTGKKVQCSRRAGFAVTHKDGRTGHYCTQHKKYEPPPQPKEVKSHRPPKVEKIVVARYEATVEITKTSIIPGWFLVDEWDVIWNGRSFGYLGRNIAEMIMDMLSLEDCWNFGAMNRENRGFFCDEAYWKRRYERHNKSVDWKDGEERSYRKRFYRNYHLIGFGFATLKNFTPDAVGVLKKITSVIYRKCLMCPNEFYVNMLNNELLLGNDPGTYLKTKKAIIDVWNNGHKVNPSLKHAKGGVARYITERLIKWFARTYHPYEDSQIVEITPYFVYEFFSQMPVFECVKPLIPDFKFVNATNFEFMNVFTPYEFESNDIDGKYARLDPDIHVMSDYDRGMLSLIALINHRCEAHWGIQIMKRKGRRFECPDDMDDCYCCGNSHVMFQVVKNLLEASVRKETFNDLLTAIELEDEIVENGGDGKRVTIKSLFRDL